MGRRCSAAIRAGLNVAGTTVNLATHNPHARDADKHHSAPVIVCYCARARNAAAASIMRMP